MHFLYFYSPFYAFYHDHLTETLGPHFDLEPQLIEDITEKEDKTKHHFDGLTIKIDLILAAIQKYMGEIIVFSDATIFVNKEKSHELKDFFLQYQDYDLVFINEYITDDIIQYNVGMIQIKCSEKTLDFFNRVLERMKNTTDTHDQDAINREPKDNLRHTRFDSDRIFCQYFREDKRHDYLIWKTFITNRGKVSNFNQRLDQFYEKQLISTETYHKYIK